MYGLASMYNMYLYCVVTYDCHSYLYVKFLELIPRSSAIYDNYYKCYIAHLYPVKNINKSK